MSDAYTAHGVATAPMPVTVADAAAFQLYHLDQLERLF